MKVVWTFIMITFAISILMVMAGIVTNEFSAAAIVSGLLQQDLSTSTLLFAFFGIGAAILTMTGVAAFNIVTGGNASVGITTGYSVFAIWCVSLVLDWLSIISKVGDNCNLVSGGLCVVGYYAVYAYGILLFVGFVYSLIDLVGGND